MLRSNQQWHYKARDKWTNNDIKQLLLIGLKFCQMKLTYSPNSVDNLFHQWNHFDPVISHFLKISVTEVIFPLKMRLSYCQIKFQNTNKKYSPYEMRNVFRNFVGKTGFGSVIGRIFGFRCPLNGKMNPEYSAGSIRNFSGSIEMNHFCLRREQYSGCKFREADLRTQECQWL